MKVSIDTKLYAVVNTKTNELVPRYTGGFFWTRRGDAERKFNDLNKRGGSYELLTCGLNIVESTNTEEARRRAKEIADKKAADEKLKRELASIRDKKINELLNQLKELTGLTHLPSIKTFVENTMMIPDYKQKIVAVIDQLKELNYTGVTKVWI